MDTLLFFYLLEISIHALREEGDQTREKFSLRPVKFLSTPSARRATLAQINGINANIAFLSTPSARRATFTFRLTPDAFRISIHALREEGDS